MWLEFPPAVGDELAQAHEWSKQRQSGLGDDFLDELQRVLEQIAANPARTGFVQGDVRAG